MKTIKQFFNFFAITLLSGMFFISCSSEEPAVGPVQATISDTLTVEDLDDFSDHLQFLGATKKDGKAPAAPTSSSLKFSIRDTLHLGPITPVNFLHDESTNVAGVYIQVQGSIGSTGGTFASHYYDVAEVADAAESDTVSTVMVGFDPTDSEVTPPFHITITPYDEDGEPLDQAEVPVVVDEPTGSGECGLVLPPGEYWSWNNSFILYPNINSETPQDSITRFYSAPFVVYGGNQIIKGCCVDGFSDYGATCVLGDPRDERSLPFPTYYQIAYESLEFSDNGTFKRITQENSANPLPDESDFCSGGVGVVDIKVSLINYTGNWTTEKLALSQDLNLDIDQLDGDPNNDPTLADYLTLLTTSSSAPGAGFGNPGGLVFHLSCSQLMLVQFDKEGFGNELYKVYVRIGPDGVEWWELHH